MEFHERLRLERVRCDITQVQMAKLLGVARQTYLDLESGKTEPRRAVIIKIANILDLQISVFFQEHNFDELSKMISLLDSKSRDEAMAFVSYLSAKSNLGSDHSVGAVT